MAGDSGFNFTWGLPELEGFGYVQVFQFMLRTYADLGLTRLEMLAIIHAASYHYNSPGGESRPSLQTIADEMGYADKAKVSHLFTGLEEKGMLIVNRTPGKPNVYDASPFARKAFQIWIGRVAQNGNTSVAQTGNGGLPKQATEEEERKEEPKKKNSPPDGGPVLPPLIVTHNLDDVVFQLEDTGIRKNDMTAMCPRCHAVHEQTFNVCPDCKAHVIWYQSPKWKKLYGDPDAYRRKAQGEDLTPRTPLQTLACGLFNRSTRFANVSQQTQFKRLENKYPGEYVEAMMHWATDPAAFKGFDRFVSGVENPNNLKTWEADKSDNGRKDRRTETPGASKTDQESSVADEWAEYLAARAQATTT